MEDDDNTQEAIVKNSKDTNSEEDEFSVEKLVNKRINPESGGLEYEVKWLDYPESDNTWEPIDHLNCQDLIAKFEDELKQKQKDKAKKPKASQSISKDAKEIRKVAFKKTPRKNLFLKEDSSTDDENIQVEGDDDNDDTNFDDNGDFKTNGPTTNGSSPGSSRLRDYDRNLEIIGPSIGDHNKLFFFVKWEGSEELDLVHVNELEEKVPKRLCVWYRDRLFHDLKFKENELV